jgi:hypothetical protein
MPFEALTATPSTSMVTSGCPHRACPAALEGRRRRESQFFPENRLQIGTGVQATKPLHNPAGPVSLFGHIAGTGDEDSNCLIGIGHR